MVSEAQLAHRALPEAAVRPRNLKLRIGELDPYICHILHDIYPDWHLWYICSKEMRFLQVLPGIDLVASDPSWPDNQGGVF